MEYFIGLDLGTTAVKAVSLSADGTVLRECTKNVQFIEAAEPSAVEIDPDGYFQRIWEIIKNVTLDSYTLKGIAWAAASGNLLFLDQQCFPVSPIYSWLDTRPADGSISRELSALDSEWVYRTVGWPVSPQFPLGRLLWLNKHTPSLVNGSHRICMNNDYLGYLLTGKFLLDDSTATTFYLYDQEKKEPSEELLSITGVKTSQISPVRQTGTVLGELTPEAHALLGLRQDTPVKVVLGSFDHPSAARAAGLAEETQLMLSCGTSWVGCMILPNRSWGLENNMLIDPFTSSSGGSWFGMISLPGAGKLFDLKVRQFFSQILQESSPCFKTFDRLAVEADASQVPVLQFFDAPDEEDFTKLANTYTKESIARGILESVVFQFTALLESRGISTQQYREVLLVGGPTKSPIWPQIISDMFGKPLYIRFGQNAGAVGAAAAAAAGTGTSIVLSDHAEAAEPDAAVSRLVQNRYQEFLRRR